MKRALHPLGLFLVLIAARSHAEDRIQPAGDWGRVDSEHLTLYGNVSDAELARVAGQLERMVEVEVRLTVGTTAAAPRPTYVFVFRNAKSMEPYLGELAGTKTRVGGVFWPAEDANFSILDYSVLEDPTPLLYHEWTHYFTSTNLPWLPIWLHEGLAGYFGTARIEKKYAEVGRSSTELIDALSYLPWRPWPEIFAWENSVEQIHDRDPETVGASYAQAWALTHFLMQGDDDRTDAFNAFLARLRSGESTEGALGKVYGLALDDLDGAIKNHVFTVREHFLTLSFSSELGQGIRGFSTPTRAELLGRLGDLLAHNSAPDDPWTDQHLDAALMEDPRCGPALVARGSLGLRRRDWPVAVASLAQAAEVEPRSARAQSLLGHACLAQWNAERESSMPDSTPPLLLQARGAFRAAIEAQPDLIDERVGLAETYIGETGSVWEGIQVLDAVLEEDPGHQDALELLIHLMARSGNLPGAWISLEKARVTALDSTRVVRVERNLADEELLRLRAEADTLDPLAVAERLTVLSTRVRDEETRSRILALRKPLDELAEKAAETADLDRRVRPPEPTPARAPIKIKSPEIDRYNEAVRLARRGELAPARRIFEELAAGSKIVDLADSARAQLGQVRLYERHRVAVKLAVAGRVEEAIALLDSVLAAKPRWGLKDEAEANLQKLRAGRSSDASR